MLMPSHAFIAVKLETTGKFERNLNRNFEFKTSIGINQDKDETGFANFRLDLVVLC